MLGITRRAAVLAAAADGHPARLFKGGEPGFCLPSVAEAFRFGTLWQDSAGSTPGAVGLTVGRVGFIAGRSSIASQTTATKRPLLTTDSKSIPLLRFDGLDDCLVTPSIDFSACEAVTVIIGIRKNAGTATGLVFEHGPVSTPGNFGVFAPGISVNDGNNIYCVVHGTSNGGFSYAFKAGSSTVFASVFVGSELTRRDKAPIYSLNGNSMAPRGVAGYGYTDTDVLGQGNFTTAVAYIGQRDALSIPFNGDLYSLTVVGRRISNAEMLNTSRWINQQMGVVY